MSAHGDAALAMIGEVLADGVDHAAVLLRHSARTFEPGLHDLDNLLTDEGRALCCRFGRRLPKELTLRAYASPAQRCLETAQLILEAHEAEGGSITRHRPVEALGVFYALDQMKMWKGMEAVGGMANYLQSWLAGAVPADAMMPAHWAARLVLGCVTEKLTTPVSHPHLDLHVSHDMTLYLLRGALLGEPVDGPPVEFLDGLLVWRAEGALWLKSQHGSPQRVSAELTD
ncbi:MAG: histidine phosphatase family protein [Gammaproteobacteria bacterium]|nr:histidine phosphatase family protein [Gammaproteobacteria bacterium]